jgi:hypothetical protein
MRVRFPDDIRCIGKAVLVNGVSTEQSGLKVFSLKTGPKGFVDCYQQPLSVGKNGNVRKHRIRANVEVIS